MAGGFSLRFAVVVLALLALAPVASAAIEQRVELDSSDYVPSTKGTAATAKVDLSVATGDIDTSRCGAAKGTDVDSQSCQQAVGAGKPAAELEYAAALELDLGLLRERAARERASGAASVAGAAAPSAVMANTLYLATAGAAAFGLAAVLYLAWRVAKYGLLGFVPMYTHIRDGDLLKDPNRARIFDLIKSEPGISTKDIADRLGLAWGTVTHHLGKLEKRQFVVSKKYGKYRRFFANGAAADAVKKDTLAILKVPATAEVAHVIRDRPGASQKEVSEVLGVSSSTILWHVKRLEKVSLVQKIRDGKQVRYYPGDMLRADWQPVRDIVAI